jgi:hypothetical protein
MIEIAFRQGLLEVLTSRKTTKRAQGEVNRGWQDKSRKVRPVGRTRNLSNFKLALDLAKIRRNFMGLPRHCAFSSFDTLRRAK